MENHALTTTPNKPSRVINDLLADSTDAEVVSSLLSTAKAALEYQREKLDTLEDELEAATMATSSSPSPSSSLPSKEEPPFHSQLRYKLAWLSLDSPAGWQAKPGNQVAAVTASPESPDSPASRASVESRRPRPAPPSPPSPVPPPAPPPSPASPTSSESSSDASSDVSSAPSDVYYFKTGDEDEDGDVEPLSLAHENGQGNGVDNERSDTLSVDLDGTKESAEKVSELEKKVQKVQKLVEGLQNDVRYLENRMAQYEADRQADKNDALDDDQYENNDHNDALKTGKYEFVKLEQRGSELIFHLPPDAEPAAEKVPGYLQEWFEERKEIEEILQADKYEYVKVEQHGSELVFYLPPGPREAADKELHDLELGMKVWKDAVEQGRAKNMSRLEAFRVLRMLHLRAKMSAKELWVMSLTT